MEHSESAAPLKQEMDCMSYGKMNMPAILLKVQTVKDKEGFPVKSEVPLAAMRVYREGRHGSLKWANLSAFSDATDLFRFRKLNNTEVTPTLILSCGGDRFEILSVEDVKGRGMYTEVLARKVVAAGG